MKELKFLGIFIIVFSMMACQKDKQITIKYDEDRDVKVLKVEYDGLKTEGDYFEKGVVWYHYDEQGRLNKTSTEYYNYGEYYTSDKTIIHYDNNKIRINNNIYDNMCWNWVELDVLGKEVTSILVNTSFSGPIVYNYEGIVDILRDHQGRVSSVLMKPTVQNQQSTYMPVTSNIYDYNGHNLPKSSISIDRYKDTIGFAPFYMANESDIFSGQFKFDFEYTTAQGVPNKLKRMVNEELLYLNRYGVTNFDEYKIAGTDIIFPSFSINGEGNWLVSFGLPQYHILEDRSSHIVSKRTTKHYKINDAGEQEYFKTTVEDFPYVHDAEAKTLEIAGLKIWYEFVE